MPEYLAPGVYVEEVSFRAKSIEGVPTSTTGFAGITHYGPVRYPGGPKKSEPRLITSFTEFERVYGSLNEVGIGSGRPAYLAHAARAFFENGGKRLYVSRVFTPRPGDLPRGVASRAIPDGGLTATWKARWPGALGNVLVRRLQEMGDAAKSIVIWAGVVIGVIVLVGSLAARILPGRGSDFVLELPPLRVPQIRNIAVKTLARIEWYLKEAVPLFVLGTLILFVADRLRLLGSLERLAEPVLTGALGLPRETASAFVVGFLRRDFGAAGLFDLARHGRLSPVQIVVSMVTITLFIPCIANFFMIVKERGWKTAMAIAAFILPFTLLVGGALNAILRAVPGPWR